MINIGDQELVYNGELQGVTAALATHQSRNRDHAQIPTRNTNCHQRMAPREKRGTDGGRRRRVGGQERGAESVGLTQLSFPLYNYG
jgi:hypothetical protein